MTLMLCLFFALGLIVGSFANVVIHRLPKMLLEPELASTTPPYSLSQPPSHCPSCDHPIRWFHNVPVLSFLWLAGRCPHCHTDIAWRYPLVELCTGVLWLLCAWHWPMEKAVCWSLFATTLLTLSVIDWRTTLLPDTLTQPLLWAGLLAHVAGLMDSTLTDAVLGAALGYVGLWSVAHLFEKVTGKVGMGGGDFKLLAAIGAWLGAGLLLPIVWIASVTGAVIGIYLKTQHRLVEGRYLPFGPFLAAAAMGAAIWAQPLQVFLWSS